MMRVSWKKPSVRTGRTSALQAGRREEAGGPPAEPHRLAAPEGGQPAQLHGEDVDEADADQEGRQRDADERQHHDALATIPRRRIGRVDAERDADATDANRTDRTASSTVAGSRSRDQRRDGPPWR